MSLSRMILYSKLTTGLCKMVTISQFVTKFNVTKSRLHCTKVEENDRIINRIKSKIVEIETAEIKECLYIKRHVEIISG